MLLKLLFSTDRERFLPFVVSLTDKGTIGLRIEALGVPVYALGMRRGVPSPRILLDLARVVRQEQPQIVQGWMYHGNIVAQLASLFTERSTPILWNIRGTHTNLREKSFLTAFIIWLGARLSSLPTAIINNSYVSALSHEQKLGYRTGKWKVIPNGFDTNIFIPSNDAKIKLRSELGISPETIIIGLIGRYHPIKDHAGFLKAASFLLQKHPEVHFVLIGEKIDEDNSELKSFLREIHLRKAVHLLGVREDISYLTAAFDIATSSSLAEGFPNVVGEAMSCEVPCVVTDVGDSARIVGDTGRVVPLGNPEKLADAWTELIIMDAEDRKKLGKLARQRIIDNFSLLSVVSQYQNLYVDVFKRKELP